MLMGSGAKGLRLGVFGVLAAAAAWAGPRGEAVQGPVVFVVPAREAVVRLAMDMTSLRSSYVISYQAIQGSDTPLIHTWDGASRSWIETNIEDYGAGARFSRVPSTAFFMGTETEFPAKLEDYAGWAAHKVRLANLNVVPCLNAFHEVLNFAPSEWRWLARRYDLDLKDNNVERRRYGRYGPPGQPAAGALPPGSEPMPNEQGSVIMAVPPAEEPPPLAQPPVEPVTVDVPVPEAAVVATPTPPPEPVPEAGPAPVTVPPVK
jgi:hypothetical protein